MSETDKTIADLHELSIDRGPREKTALTRAITALRACEEIRAAVRLAQAGVTPGLDLDLIAELLP